MSMLSELRRRELRNLLVDAFVQQHSSSGSIAFFDGIHSRDDWNYLFDYAASQKVFCDTLRLAHKSVPKDLLFRLKNVGLSLSMKTRQQALALIEFNRACSKEFLNYVVIKGFSFSALIYDDALMRYSTDIDILIDPDDSTKCDYIMRSLGFRQLCRTDASPFSGRGANSLIRSKASFPIDYLVRRRKHDNQFLPYTNEQGVRIEVHDSIRDLSTHATYDLLWDANSFQLNSESIPSPSITNNVLLLLLNLYQNAECFYSALDRDICLRDFMDLHNLIRSKRFLGWDKLVNIAKEYGVFRNVSIALSDYKDLYREYACDFPCHEDMLDGTSQYDVRIQNRLVNEDEFIHSALFMVRQGGLSVPGCEIACNSVDNSESDFFKPSIWNMYENKFGFNIAYAIDFNKSGMRIKWRIPKCIFEKSNQFAYKLSIIPARDLGFLSINLNIALSGNKFECAFHKSNRLEQKFSMSGKAAKKPVVTNASKDGVVISAQISFDEVFPVDLSSLFEAYAIPAIFQRFSSQIYYSIGQAKDSLFHPISLRIKDSDG